MIVESKIWTLVTQDYFKMPNTFSLEKYLFCFCCITVNCVSEKCDLGLLIAFHEMFTTMKQIFKWLGIIDFTEVLKNYF